MTEVLAPAPEVPPVGEVLTAETSRLLKVGDRLRSSWNWPHTRWLGECTITRMPSEVRTLFMARFDQSGETGGFGGYVGDRLSAFTFLSRQSDPAGDDGSISAQGAEIPTEQVAEITSLREQIERLKAENKDLKAIPWPRAYVMERASEWDRLLRETHGYIHTCRGRCGSDTSGRDHALAALAEARKMLADAPTSTCGMEANGRNKPILPIRVTTPETGLREALEPFAREAKDWPPTVLNLDHQIVVISPLNGKRLVTRFKWSDLLRAENVLEALSKGEGA